MTAKKEPEWPKSDRNDKGDLPGGAKSMPPDAKVSRHGADGEGGAEEEAIGRPAPKEKSGTS